ncbi:MAG: BrnT family toxin [Elusimicrobiota bacterium]
MIFKYKTYEWDDNNISHILKHAVSPNEVEEACFNTPFTLRSKDGRYLVYGRSDAGRYLFVVLVDKGHGVIRLITARDMEDKDRKLYHRKK